MGQRWCTPCDRDVIKVLWKQEGHPFWGFSEVMMSFSYLLAWQGCGRDAERIRQRKNRSQVGVTEGPAAWKMVHCIVTWSNILTGCRASFLGSNSSFMDIIPPTPSPFPSLPPLFPLCFLPQLGKSSLPATSRERVHERYIFEIWYVFVMCFLGK